MPSVAGFAAWAYKHLIHVARFPSLVLDLPEVHPVFERKKKLLRRETDGKLTLITKTKDAAEKSEVTQKSC